MKFKERVINITAHVKNAIIRRTPKEKIKRVNEIYNLLNFKQILDVLCLPFIFIISMLCKPFLKNIWIIEENPNEACDNGYIFYKYIRENRKDINVYYVIKKKSKDYLKVKTLGNVINHGSLKHWVYYLNAKKIIVSQKYANPSPAIFYILHVKNFLKQPRIYLKHGITKDNATMLYYDRTRFRLFICGAKKEFEYVKEKFEYPEENVVYTGFARFDNLDLSNQYNNTILIAPTWRNWIKSQEEFNEFIQNYYKIINNKVLINYLEKYGLNLQLVLHKNMKRFKLEYKPKSKNIQINHNNEVDIQELLNRAALLITDYSSLFFDIAYRKRPIIFYQFDKKEYRKNQLPEGYFSYEKDGFGVVVQDAELVLNKIFYYIENEFNVEESYLRKMNNFFERRDKNNCKRILEEIEKI